ncbi:MAG: polyprenyl synthetase family protein [Burkholderiaceae bacterium]|nr:polyprenyl synthetase family protein [Burkholderiaceae bacterium]
MSCASAVSGASLLPSALDHWVLDAGNRFEEAARRALPRADLVPMRLHRAMRYAVLDGGKRVRPLLVYAAGEVTQADGDALDRAALAVEFVHAYSLVHDDMPCMDDDVLRRGKPTVHVEFDEATAMLAGDALQAEAFKVIADGGLPASQTAALMRELAHASSTLGMCGGQAIDLDAIGTLPSIAELEQMHRMKTGALLKAAVLMGALSGRTAVLTECTREALAHYGEAIGLAFQVVDDLLDVEASTAQLGKTAGKDARGSKPTYVSLLGAEAARALSLRLRAQALQAVEGLGTSALRLRELADFIVCRKS